MFWGDFIGMRLPQALPHASVASNAADGAVAGAKFIVPTLPTGKTAKLLGATWSPNSSQAGSGTNYRTLQILNLGTGGAGTTVMASFLPSATAASVAANGTQALTNSSTASDLTVTAGQVISFYTVSAGNGIDIVAGTIQMEWQIT